MCICIQIMVRFCWPLFRDVKLLLPNSPLVRRVPKAPPWGRTLADLLPSQSTSPQWGVAFYSGMHPR